MNLGFGVEILPVCTSADALTGHTAHHQMPGKAKQTWKSNSRHSKSSHKFQIGRLAVELVMIGESLLLYISFAHMTFAVEP